MNDFFESFLVLIARKVKAGSTYVVKLKKK